MIEQAVSRGVKNGDIHQPDFNEWTGVKNSKEIRLETGWFLAPNMLGFQPSIFPSSTSYLGANDSPGILPCFQRVPIIGTRNPGVTVPG